VIAHQRGQPVIPTQLVEIVHALTAQRAEQHEGLYHLPLAQALGRAFRRQLPLRRRQHPAAPAQLYQQSHARVGRHLLRQATLEVDVQGVG